MSRFFFDRLTSRPSNTEFTQFFLQTLAMQADRRRGARHVPAVACQLLRQIGDLKFMLRLAKIAFAESNVRAVVARLPDEHFARRDFFGQVGNTDFVAAAQHEAPLERVLEFANVPRPIVSLNRSQRFTAESRRPA